MPAAKENKYAIGNTGGRPPIYETPELLQNSVDNYFEYIKGEFHIETSKITDKETGKKNIIKEMVWDRRPEPATVTGLSLFLGFSDRQSLYDYEKHKEFSGIIKNGRSRVEHEYEKNLHENNPAGSIFALKNMGWRDKIETGQTDNEGNDIIQTSLTDQQFTILLNTINEAAKSG